jgi:protein SCO1
MPASAPLHRRPWLWLGLGIAMLMGVWSQFKLPPPATSGAAQGSGEALIGGPFALVDQSGTPRTDKDLLGRYGLVYFGYSFCPDVCPTDLAALSAGLAQFETADNVRGARVQPVFITIDPARDTVAAMKVFALGFHPRLWALTGRVAAVEAAKKAFRVYAEKNVDARDPKNYLMDHSALFYLIGPDGKYVAHMQGNARPEQIAAWLKQHVS